MSYLCQYCGASFPTEFSRGSSMGLAPSLATHYLDCDVRLALVAVQRKADLAEATRQRDLAYGRVTDKVSRPARTL